MNSLDQMLQAACPTVMIPRYEELNLLDTDTHRFLVAHNGLFAEIKRPWLHAVFNVVDSPVPLPYGEAPRLFDIRIQRRALVRGLLHFIRRAKELSPLEHAAWLTYDPVEGAIHYCEPLVVSRSEGHIQYHRPEASPRHLPVVDMHSHGIFPAFFSKTDDEDDRTDDAKLAFVVGNLDSAEVSTRMRFVGLGISEDISKWVMALLHNENTSHNTDADFDHD